MMKATLEFNMYDPDDKLSHLRAVKALDMALALYDIDNALRSREKYDAPELTREKLHEILSNREIQLDELLI